jgi:hypothetical protein
MPGRLCAVRSACAPKPKPSGKWGMGRECNMQWRAWLNQDQWFAGLVNRLSYAAKSAVWTEFGVWSGRVWFRVPRSASPFVVCRLSFVNKLLNVQCVMRASNVQCTQVRRPFFFQWVLGAWALGLGPGQA